MTKAKPNISLCMIVRNEEKMIGQCLSSVKDYVDEIVVVDTGSQDRTLEIAQSFNARIFHHPWKGSFSESRNHSISHATGDWILVLDADEQLARRDAQRLHPLIDSVKVKGYKLIQRSYLWNANVACSIPNPRDYEEGQQYPDCVDVFVIRLFLKDPEIRYQGRVHELVDPLFDAKGLTSEKTDLVIHHFGKVGDPQKLEEKKWRYLDLGRQKVAEEPENAMAHFELGTQLYEVQQHEESIPYFKKAYALNSNLSFSLLYIAMASQILGKTEQADQLYKKCLRLAPHNQRVLLESANFQRDQGHLRTAIEYYERVMALNPRHALATFNLGGIYLRLGRIEEGFGLLKKAIHLDPNNEKMMENFGRLSLRGCHLEEAAELLEDFSERFPESFISTTLLAEISFKLKRFERAFHWASRGLEIRPSSQPLHLLRAHSAFGLGKLDQAEESYRVCLEEDEDHLDSLMNLAAIADHRGQWDRAENYYARALRQHPEEPLALKKYGLLLAKKSLDLKAQEILEKAHQKNPEDRECLLLLGMTYERTGHLKDAIALYQNARQQNPKLDRLAVEKIHHLESLQASGILK